MKTVKNNMDLRGLLIIFISTLILISLGQKADGQEKPPRPIKIEIRPQGDLKFGAFVTSTGGSVTVYAGGGIDQSGGIILLNLASYPYSPASFSIEGNIGTVVHLDTDHLTGTISDGFSSMSLSYFDCVPGKDFIITSSPMIIYIGFKLNVGSSLVNLPGTYGGTFPVTVIQE